MKMDAETTVELEILDRIAKGDAYYGTPVSNFGSGIRELIRQRDELAEELRKFHTARPYSEWHEDDGPVLWELDPIEEPPYCGTPLDTDFPYDVDCKQFPLYWTPLPDCGQIQKSMDEQRAAKQGKS